MSRASKIASAFLIKTQANLPTRTLGNTGLLVKAIGLGGQALLEIKDQEKAAHDLINKAINFGVNYLDTAAMYGPSREYLGKIIKFRRNEVVLASKVRSRDYRGAKKELDETFKLLNTDYIDLLQLHTIEDEKDLKALKKDGALQVLIEAKNAGKIGFIGFSGHHDPDILIRFMSEYSFDTVLLPVNPAVPEFRTAVQEARRRGMGVIGMKIMSRGILPYYLPARSLVRYAMNIADVAIVGCTTETDLERNVVFASEPVSFDSVDMEALEHAVTPEIKKRAAFFMKGYDKKPWPSTYQPDMPEIQYEKKQ